MRIGDLIYCKKYDTYAIFMGVGMWTGWINVYLPDTGEKKQVHDHFWEVL